MAPCGARLIESLMLRDLTTGTAREIDIAIEIPTGLRVIRVALECRDRKRPASVQWIDEMSGKYAHLPMDRIVAVSSSGFTRAAREKGKTLNIDLLTPEEVPGFDWTKLSSVKRFVSTGSLRYDFSIIALDPAPSALGIPPSQAIDRLTVEKPCGESELLGNLVHAFLARADSRASMHKMWTDRPGEELQFRLELAGWQYRDKLGDQHPLRHADVVLRGQVVWIDIELRAMTYANEVVAHGETVLDGQPVSLVIVERKGEDPKWLWYLRDTDKEHPWRLSAAPIFAQGAPRSVSFFTGPPLPPDAGLGDEETRELDQEPPKRKQNPAS